jgi:maltose O-acetyltransferase
MHPLTYPVRAAGKGRVRTGVPVAGMGRSMGEMRERMLRGELYIADDPDNEAEFSRVQDLLGQFNRSAPAAWDERDALLRQILQHVGRGVVVRPPFFCEYGAISIGDGTFVNVDAVMLDVAPITIGAACQIATRVQLLTATHPIDPEPRRLGWEYGAPITIADNVWLGGGVIVCPGVAIGEDTVVGAGAVVTRDLPAGVVAAGVPARVLREIDERDRVEIPAR